MINPFKSKPSVVALSVAATLALAVTAMLALRGGRTPTAVLAPVATETRSDASSAPAATVAADATAPAAEAKTADVKSEPPAEPVPAPALAQGSEAAAEAAKVAARPAAAAPVLFDDNRTLATGEPATAAAVREVAAPTVARLEAPATTKGGGLFEDPRGPLVASPLPPKTPVAAPTGKSVEPETPAAKPVVVTARALPTVPASTFSDSRQLMPGTQAAAQVPAQGVGSTPTAPAAKLQPQFVDSRDPLAVDLAANRAAPAVVAAASTRPAAVPAAPDIRSPACASAQIASEPLDGGRMLLRVNSGCRAEQTVRFGYGEATLVRKLDSAGVIELTIDLFAGTASPIAVVFEDGTSREVAARASDLDKLEKIALIWRAPVDLDLHAFEYGATFGQPGHVWTQAPSSALAARDQTAASKRGRGFLSRSDDGRGSGDKIEVYTFFRFPEQPAGAVGVAVDYASRGDVAQLPYCGTGEQAEVKFETVVTSRGRVTREAGVLAPVTCGTAIAAEARFGVQHQIRVNR